MRGLGEVRDQSWGWVGSGCGVMVSSVDAHMLWLALHQEGQCNEA